MKLRWQFVLGTGLSSRAIAWFSAGHFSHVDALDSDGNCLGARSDQIGLVPPGVQVRAPAYETWRQRVVISLEVHPDRYRSFWVFLQKQLGKPYDSTAIWGFASGRDWRDPDSWFCSELQTAALEVAGVIPDLYTPRNKVTPAALATVLSAVGAKWD